MVRFVDSGDESDVGTDDGLAPVTPLFGAPGGRAYPTTAAEVQRALEDRLPAGRSAAPVRDADVDLFAPSDADTDRAVGGRAGGYDGSGTRDAFSAAADRSGGESREVEPIDLAAKRTDRARSLRGSRSGGRAGTDAATEADASAIAERGLVKKLRGRQLSVSEAKTYLGQYDLAADAVGLILDDFLQRGYLDDARLAEQVVHAGVDRKGQGRQVIAQSLAKRGVPRDVADAALAELPDDDAERALEFARSKAGSLRSLERDVALRRLAGQLARRGYGGSVALNAARTALDETMRPSGRVRFEDS